MIKRVEFVGFTVMGPQRKSHAAYRLEGADAWPKGWTAMVEGPHVILEGEGQRIEVPRARCVVYMTPTAAEPAKHVVVQRDKAAR